jgi:hypothetical protein
VNVNPAKRIAVFLALAAASRGLFAEPALDYPKNALQGQILVVRLRSALSLSAMKAQILPRGESLPPTPSPSAGTALPKAQKVIEEAAGAYRAMLGGGNAFMAFLPIPLSFKPGTYALRVMATEDGRPWATQVELLVEARPLSSMDIKLNPALTDIKASPDPRKDAESREISALLESIDPAADYVRSPFLRPLSEKAVTATFGDRRRYLYASGGSSQSIHYGLDLYADEGTPIAASGSGRVVLAKARIVTGNTVIIEHAPGLYSCYFHMQRIDAAQGDLVDAGKIIGLVGSTGLATGPHLHWELRLNAEPMDPECLVGHPFLEGFAPR